jgi:hypothetical protein
MKTNVVSPASCIEATLSMVEDLLIAFGGFVPFIWGIRKYRQISDSKTTSEN